MQEKTYTDKLIEFAEEMGFTYYTNSEVKNHLLALESERFTKSKYVVIDLQSKLKNLYLIFSDIFSTKAYTGNMYCGLFYRIPECTNEIKVIRRDWFDALSFSKCYKTGDKFIDKNVTIFVENHFNIGLKINSSAIRKFIEINKEIKPLELATIRNSLSFVPALHGNNWIALLVNGKWIPEAEKLKFIIQKGSELISDVYNINA